MRSSVPPRARDMVVSLRYAEREIPFISHYRTTGAFACIRVLEERGLRARYDAALPEGQRRVLAELLPSSWMTAETAVAHFEAVDTLGLSIPELLDLGLAAGNKFATAQMSTLLRMTREIGVTPWTFFPHSQRIWDRLCRGGDVAIERRGPKEAFVTLYGFPSTSSTYLRTMMRGVFQMGLSLWCAKGYVSEIGVTRSTLTFREAWV